MSISARRKSVFETRLTGSKIRQTLRRPAKAAILPVRPFRVNAAELARRKFLHLAAGAAALPAISQSAEAQAYPARPITIVVPFVAGGGTDVMARIFAERMRATLGQPIIVENVGGADGSIGTGRAARARPDGYTIDFGGTGTNVLNGALYSLQYDLLNGFAPISPVITYSFILYVKKSNPARDLNELIAWLKANPGKASMGVPAIGPRLVANVFQKETGTRFALVPYRGAAPAMQDLVAGQIDLFFDQAVQLPLVRSGSIKAYAVTGDGRIAMAPDIPTFAEMGLPAVSWTP